MKHSLRRGLAIMLALAVVCSLAIVPASAADGVTLDVDADGNICVSAIVGGNPVADTGFKMQIVSSEDIGDINSSTDMTPDGTLKLTGGKLNVDDPTKYAAAGDVVCYYLVVIPTGQAGMFTTMPFVYNGTKIVKVQEHGLSLSVAAFPTDLTYTGSAQNAEVTITVKSTGLQDEANVKLELTGTDADKFDLSAATITSLTAGTTDSTIKLTFKGTNAKDSYAVTVSVKSDDVATAVTANVTAKIAKADPTVTITAPTGTALSVTSGAARPAITNDTTNDTAGTIAWTTAGDVNITAANKAQGWTFTPTDATNYNNKTGTITFTVAGAIEAEVAVPEDDITYDGNSHPATGLKVTQDEADGTTTDLTSQYKVVYSKDGGADSEDEPKDVGEYTVKVVLKAAPNTVVLTAVDTIKIVKANATLTWPDPLTYTEGSDAGVTVTSNFGTPTVTYEIVTVKAAPAEGTCTCATPEDVTQHDPTAHPDCTYKPAVAEVKVTGAIDGTGVKDALKALKAGDTFTVKASVTGTDNWNAAAEETKTFTVAAAPSYSGGVSNDFTVTYAAGAHGTINGATSEKVKRNESPVNVPTVTANKGYAFIGWSLDGKTIVNPAAQTITKNTTFTALYGDHLAYMVGRSATEFVPNGNLTRAEAAAILSRLTEGFEEDGTYPAAPYSDLTAGAWYVKYVNFAADKGIVNGRDNGTFDPDANITRAEFATMIANFAKIAKVDTAAVSTDVAGHWAEGYIAALEQAKVVTGYEDGTFKPNANITRAEAATMVNGAIGRTPMSDLDLAANGYVNPFVDVTTSQWFYAQVMEAGISHMSSHFHK